MLLPIELLKLAVPDPLKVTAPGDAAVTVNIGAGVLALLTDGAISEVAAKAAATKMDLLMGCNQIESAGLALLQIHHSLYR